MCEPLAKLLRALRSWRSVTLRDAPEWLVGLHPMRSYQHGDLNAANIMVDLHGNPWYIDFAVREFKMYMSHHCFASSDCLCGAFPGYRM